MVKKILVVMVIVGAMAVSCATAEQAQGDPDPAQENQVSVMDKIKEGASKAKDFIIENAGTIATQRPIF